MFSRGNIHCNFCAGNPNIKGSKANKIRHRERKQNLMNNIEKRGQGLLVST